MRMIDQGITVELDGKEVHDLIVAAVTPSVPEEYQIDSVQVRNTSTYGATKIAGVVVTLARKKSVR